MSRTSLFCALALCATSAVGTAFGAASEFVINPPLDHPIGVAYSHVQNKLIFSQPFCGENIRKLIAVSDTGVSTLFANLPNRVPVSVHPNCWEDYVAVSPGFAGFTNGAVFVAQGRNIIQVPPNGGSYSLFTTIPDLTDTHTGITFDRVGTFGFKMLITGQNGKMYTVDSTGVATAIADTTGLASPAEVGIENGAVAPLSWGIYGGWFIVSAEDRQKVFGVSPSALPDGTHPVVTIASNFEAPEVVHFPPQILQNWGASGGVFFDIHFDTDQTQLKIWKFPASDFVPYQGQAIVPQEENGQINVIYPIAVAGQNPTIATIAFGLGQQEGSTFVTQPTTSGCTLTQGGYKNNFSSKVVSLTLGGTSYTAAQLISILNTPVAGNGAISLAYQLIAAKLNNYYGASLPANVAAAIVSADALLATVTTNASTPNKIPPVGTAYLAPATTSALTATLDAYNNGLTGPGHCN